jgi:hypothetical protein
VGGLLAAQLMSVILLPTLFAWVAGDGDELPTPAEVSES